MRKRVRLLILAATLSAAMMLAGCRGTKIIDHEERKVTEMVYQLQVSYVGTVDTGDPSAEREDVKELITGGSTTGFRVDSYDAEVGEGTVSGEFIAVENGLVEIYTHWQNLPFTDGEWIFLGGEKSHREEMERSCGLRQELLERYDERGVNE